jgi:hypothetical protein
MQDAEGLNGEVRSPPPVFVENTRLSWEESPHKLVYELLAITFTNGRLFTQRLVDHTFDHQPIPPVASN